MNKLISLFFGMCFIVSLTGCAGSSSSSPIETSASSVEVAAVESSLMLDRVVAASIIESETNEVKSSISGSVGSVRLRNRMYRAESRPEGLGLRRGDGTCIAVVNSSSISTGIEQATIEKLESGAIKITRGNGSIIETSVPVNGEFSSFTVDGIEWQASYGSEGTNITLTNTRSGMKLLVTELDDGSLTVVRDSSQVFNGRWLEDGSLDLSDNNGKRYRYRYGRSI